jgi:hypothetical protein
MKNACGVARLTAQDLVTTHSLEAKAIRAASLSLEEEVAGPLAGFLNFALNVLNSLMPR